MAQRRVAITGMGLVTPLGVGIEPFWSGLLEGRSGVRPAEDLDLADMPITHYGQLPRFDFDDYLDPKESALWSKASKLAVMCSKMALADADVEALPADRTGVILGTGYGCTFEFEEYYGHWFKRGWKRLKPVSIPKMMPNAPASHVGIQLGLRGIQFTVSTACSSGAIATGLAMERIRSGDLDACITGGIDAHINASTAGAWCALRVLSKRNDPTASRPFSADRDGLVLAEGGAVLVLEEWEQAVARGARIYAEVLGAGTSNDAANIVGPDEAGEVLAVQAALRDAGVESVDYVNAHGTSTDANDANETAVLKRIFGERARSIPVSSIKGHLGHTMGAAGAIDLAATALTLTHQRIPPTAHFVPGDERCDLDYVPEGPREAEVTVAMSNSFGFGGQNSVVVLRRAD
jgi:3-oxoacyl-[acyl-carrier-protein] synthase II